MITHLSFGRAPIAAVALAGLALASAGCELQVDSDAAPSLTVQGETTLRRAPEVFTIQGMVRAREPDRDAALGSAAETLRALREAISDLRGLEDLAFVAEDMQVETIRPFGCAPQFYGEERPADCTPIAFSADIPIMVHGGPHQVAGDAASLLAERGAESVQVVEFNVADPEGLRAQARRQAVLEALQTAEELADGAGAQLGPVISIDYRENPEPLPPIVRAQPEKIVVTGLRSSPRASIRLSPDEIEVTERVRIVFALEDS